MHLYVNEAIGSVHSEINESKNPKYVMVLSHGAGAGIHHSFMEQMALNLSSFHGHVFRFNFPYIEAGKKAPGPQHVSLSTIEAAIAKMEKQYWGLPIVVAGKSYGGRMSSHLLADGFTKKMQALVYLGFPLHAPGKEGIERAKHLKGIKIPQLFVQGSKDKLANLELIKQVIKDLDKVDLHVIKDGDHSFKLPKRNKVTPEDMNQTIAKKVDEWILSFL